MIETEYPDAPFWLTKFSMTVDAYGKDHDIDVVLSCGTFTCTLLGSVASSSSLLYAVQELIEGLNV